MVVDRVRRGREMMKRVRVFGWSSRVVAIDDGGMKGRRKEKGERGGNAAVPMKKVYNFALLMINDR
jgi:hypothetical protein